MGIPDRKIKKKMRQFPPSKSYEKIKARGLAGRRPRAVQRRRSRAGPWPPRPQRRPRPHLPPQRRAPRAQLQPLLADSLFAERFRHGGTMGRLLADVPVWLSVDPHAGLRLLRLQHTSPFKPPTFGAYIFLPWTRKAASAWSRRCTKGSYISK